MQRLWTSGIAVLAGTLVCTPAVEVHSAPQGNQRASAQSAGTQTAGTSGTAGATVEKIADDPAQWYGKKVTIKIPPGTAPGKRFRVRGLGVERTGQRGDLIVEVDVTVPPNLSEEQERLMKEFADAGGLKY